MPKQFDTENEAQVDAQKHDPAFLIVIGHPAGPFYASSTIQLSYDSKTWARLDADVTSFIQGVEGNAQARIALPGHPDPVAAMVARDELRDQPIDIYKGFLDANKQVIGTPDLLLAGRFDSGAVSSGGVEITVAEGAAAKYGRAPRQRCTPPVFNHTPRPGEKIRWKGVDIVLTPEGS